MAHLVGSQRLSEEDVERIRRLLEERDTGAGRGEDDGGNDDEEEGKR